MRWRGAHRARGRSWGLVVVLLCLATACTSPTPSPVSPTTVVAPPAVTTTPVDRTAPALEAYRGMWQDFVVAGRTSDWQSPDLSRHAIGIALTNLSRSLYADHYNGLITKGEPSLSPSVRSAEPADDPIKVVVGDCADSTKWLKYYVSTGKPVGGGGGHSRITGVVEKQADGAWKVTDYAVEGVGSC